MRGCDIVHVYVHSALVRPHRWRVDGGQSGGDDSSPIGPRPLLGGAPVRRCHVLRKQALDTTHSSGKLTEFRRLN
jgi:hypothetical protein